MLNAKQKLIFILNHPFFHCIADPADSALLPVAETTTYTSYRLSLMAGKCCPMDNTSPREAQSLLIQVALKT
jgi:hypothetical protein